MRVALFLIVLTFFLSILQMNCKKNVDIKCDDVSHTTFFGKVSTFFSSSRQLDLKVDFYISTNAYRYPTRVNFEDAKSLHYNGFDRSAKTIILIHGYRSGGLKRWVLELKDKLLDKMACNVISVDWDSYDPNYIQLAQSIGQVTDKLYDLLILLRQQFESTTTNSQINNEWRHLYFIGHSIGAHVSGQVAYLLKETDDFWKIDRITGLDPAKPCFSGIDESLVLDKTDADFVDVIHTQVGKRIGPLESLGAREPLGHVDFYVNGGVKQPGCSGFKFNRFVPFSGISKMVCSHRYAYKYFINTLDSWNGCHFSSFEWNGTYEGAQGIIDSIKNNSFCSDCPEMGVDAPEYSKKSGVFMVVTGTIKPYCRLSQKDLNYVLSMIEKIEDHI